MLTPSQPGSKEEACPRASSCLPFHPLWGPGLQVGLCALSGWTFSHGIIISEDSHTDPARGSSTQLQASSLHTVRLTHKINHDRLHQTKELRHSKRISQQKGNMQLRKYPQAIYLIKGDYPKYGKNSVVGKQTTQCENEQNIWTDVFQEDIKMVNGHLQRCLAALLIGETRIKRAERWM